MPLPIRPISLSKEKQEPIDYSFLLSSPANSPLTTKTASNQDANLLMSFWKKIKNIENTENIKMSSVNKKEFESLKAKGYLDGTAENYSFTAKGKNVIKVMVLAEDNNFLKSKKPKTYLEILASNKKKGKKGYRAADFSGYFSGNVPDYAANLIGTASVDASQIKSAFGKTDDAIKMVNQFDGNLLKNITFIFNFSQSGAYGVYLGELDKAIKTKALTKQLEQKGYKVTDQNGVLTAFSEKGDIGQEQIDKDIENLYKQLDQGGGTAIGVNMAKIIQSSHENSNSIPSPDPDWLFEQLTILHLGETIVHECTHALGHSDEGPSEAAEQNFANWALPQINQKYMQHLKSIGKDSEFQEIILSGQKKHAKSIDKIIISNQEEFNYNLNSSSLST